MEDGTVKRVGHEGESAGLDAPARDRLAALGEVAAEVAHELRNVLQVIASNLYVARRNPTEGGPYLDAAERSTRQAQGIVDDVMALARGDALPTDSTPLTEVVAAARLGASEEATPHLAKATREVHWVDDFPTELRVRAHPSLLARVLQGLYVNALEATAPHAVTLSTRALVDGDHVHVEVSDDGPGIAPTLRASVFDPLVTGRPGGSGLGLALARRIVLAHGGAIALVDAASGQTTFRISLPRVEAAKANALHTP